jgi:anti-sigma factor ChrR (cupin superfamily)
MSRQDNRHGPELIERAALYVAGCLPHAARRAFEEQMRTDPEAAAAVAAFDPVAVELARAAGPVTPDPRVKEALLRRIAAAEDAPAAASSLVIRRANEDGWKPSPYPGISLRILHTDRTRRQFTALLRMAPGATFPVHDHSGDEECYVLDGDLRVAGHVLGPGDYQYAPSGSRHVEQTTEGGCTCLLIAPLEELVAS